MVLQSSDVRGRCDYLFCWPHDVASTNPHLETPGRYLNHSLGAVPEAFRADVIPNPRLAGPLGL